MSDFHCFKENTKRKYLSSPESLEARAVDFMEDNTAAKFHADLFDERVEKIQSGLLNKVKFEAAGGCNNVRDE